MYKDYSVLMSVYSKENPEYFKQAIQSILDQTLPSNDFVIVCDGNLTEGLDAVIENYKELHPDLFRIIRLQQNQGLGKALNIGIEKCRHQLVARMDSDDISLPKRCQMQVEYFNENPDCDVLSGSVAEFFESIDKITSVKALPVLPNKIRTYSKYRNPINHPCVMYKKDAVIECGSYQTLQLMEDYYLWIRMLEKGKNLNNLSQVLLLMRSGPAMYKRRCGLKYLKSLYTLRKYQYELHQINRIEFGFILLNHGAVAILPNWLRVFFYKIFLRKGNKEIT